MGFFKRAVHRLAGHRRGDYKTFEVSTDVARAAVDVQGSTGALHDLFFSHTGRLVWKWTHYLDAYEEQLATYRQGVIENGVRRPLRLLEIGVLHGGSVQIWRRYLGPDAVIFGVDIDPAMAKTEDLGAEIRVGSQADPAFLRDVVAEMGGVDVVIDDGSHVAEHQHVAFKTLFPLLSDGGLYVVEDLHTSYWWDYGGAYGKGGSFLETTKRLIDDMHAWYHSKGDRGGVGASMNIPRISVYDSIVFIQKRARSRPMATKVGAPSF